MDHILSRYEDKDLVALAQGGMTEAFAELIRRHRGVCLRMALSILGKRDQAEDEVQNACWRAYRSIGRFSGRSSFSTWLVQIVRNQCLSRLRQPYDKLCCGLEEGVYANLGLCQSTPEMRLARSEVEALVRREIGLIPHSLRQPLILRDMMELPFDQVAERLNISVPAAKARLSRARTELRGRLARHFGNRGAATLIV